jgi:hypothetical protein
LKVREQQSKARRRYIIILSSFLKVNCEHMPFFNRASGFIRNNDWASLYALAVYESTVVYDSASSFYLARQFSALILKYPWKPSEIGLPDPRETAIKTFHTAERSCEKSNRRFIKGRTISRYEQYLDVAAAEIERLIGEEPDVSKILAQCSFSSGANIGIGGGKTNLYRKLYATDWASSPTALPYAIASLCSNEQFLYALNKRNDAGLACISRDPADWTKRIAYASFNHISFVPKTAKTHRAIAIEPILNSFVQKGIDKNLRDKLLRWNLDLSDQVRNQEMARVGSIDDSLCTMDLSSASDSISVQLVRRLLPRSWFCLLDCTRSPSYKLGGVVTRSHKFVSMGNGFCFPLETLIFAALARSVMKIDGVTDRRYSVYGDDIIVPSDAYEQLRKVLTFCGFTLNNLKSFKDGPFRESCGADWYKGLDVRPVFLDYHMSDVSQAMIFHNGTLRGDFTRESFEQTRTSIRSWFKDPFLRPFGKYSVLSRSAERWEVLSANGAFTVPKDLFMSSRWARWNRNEQRWSWKEYTYSPKADTANSNSFDHARTLASIREPGSTLSLRYATKRRTLKR